MRFSPHSDPVSVLFFRTRLGEEVQVADLLRDALGQDPGSVRVFFSLGSYDLIAIVAGAARDRLRRFGTINGLLAACEIVADALTVDGQLPMKRLENAHLLTLTLVRLPPHLKAGENEGVERRFLDSWGDKHADDQTLLLSTYGGPEFVALRSNPDLTGFKSWIESLSSEGNPVRRTHTIIATSHEVFDAGVRNEAGAPGGVDLGRIPRGANAQLQVSWSANAESALMAVVASVFEDMRADGEHLVCGHCHAGEEDFTVSLRFEADHELYDVFRRVIQFRQRAGHAARSTNTRLLVPLGDVVQQTAAAGSDPIQLRLSQAEADAILERRGLLGSSILDFLYDFSNIAEDEDVVGDVGDALHYWYSLREVALDDEDHFESERRLANMILYAREGLTQRLHGFRGPVSGIVNSLPHPLGGINRILLAAHAIPTEVIGHLRTDAKTQAGLKDRRWAGLVNVGPFFDYQAREHRVISLPEAFIMLPNRWISLVHESAHCYHSANRKAYEKLEKAIPSSLIQLYREFVPDLIDFHFSPSALSAPEGGSELLRMWFEEYWQYYGIPGLRKPSEEMWLRPVMIRAAFNAGAHIEKERGPRAEPRLAPAYRQLLEDYETWRDSWDRGTSVHAALELALNQMKLGANPYPMLHSKELERLAQTTMAHVSRSLPFGPPEIADRRRWWESTDVHDLTDPDRLFASGPDDGIECSALFLWKLWQAWPDEMDGSNRAVALSVLAARARRHIAKHL